MRAIAGAACAPFTHGMTSTCVGWPPVRYPSLCGVERNIIQSTHASTAWALAAFWLIKKTSPGLPTERALASGWASGVVALVMPGK